MSCKGAVHVPALGRVLQVKAVQKENRSMGDVISIRHFPGVPVSPLLGPDSFIVQDAVQTHPVFQSLQSNPHSLETSNSRQQ